MRDIKSIQYPKIATEIDVMAKRDQNMRKKAVNNQGDSWDENIDKQNTARMKEIVMQIGWPNISKVGTKPSFNAWLLVQHADMDVEFQKHCLNLMKQEHVGEVALRDIAYLEDRIRINNGQPQLYGTQFFKKEGKFIPREIEDQENVDQRRKEMGLNTFAEGVKDMEEKYNIKKPEE